MHELDLYAFELPAIEEWISGDDRTLAFQVVDDTGAAVDISNATPDWRLYARPYHDDPADAVLTGDDSGVEIVTDSRVDTTNGEWEVWVDGDATGDRWGNYWHRPVVEQPDGTRASWKGKIVLTA
jgi:hypothetical protein